MGTVHRWITANATPLTEPAALDPVLAGADVVGLGFSVRHAHELLALTGNIAHHLVTRHGFRSVLIEGDDAAGELLDSHVRTGTPDPHDVLATARPFLRVREMVDLVRWIRAHNEAHPDDEVRIAHDTAPQPAEMDAIEHQLARKTLAWRRDTGHRIVYIGGMAHTAVSSSRYVPPDTHARRSGGAHLRAALGDGYRSIGLMFGSGHAGYRFPAPPAEFAESAFAEVTEPVLVDLRARAPREVLAWQRQLALTRLIGPRYDPAHDADYHLAGGSLAAWFDALIYLPTVTDAIALQEVQRS